MKHSIMFKIKRTGETALISSKCFDDKKELTVAILDDSDKGYHEIEVEVLQQEESDRRH